MNITDIFSQIIYILQKPFDISASVKKNPDKDKAFSFAAYSGFLS